VVNHGKRIIIIGSGRNILEKKDIGDK